MHKSAIGMISTFFFSKFEHDAWSQPSEIERVIPASLQSWFASFTIFSTRRHCRQRAKCAVPAEEARRHSSTPGCYSGWDGQDEGNRDWYFGVA